MGLPAFAANYLFIGPLIAARLAAQVADTPVDVVERSEQLLEADHRVRVLLVMWAGDAPAGDAADGRSQKMRQRWLVVLALNNAGKQPDARHLAAGALLSQAHKALAGWTPEGAVTPLRRAAAALRPEFTKTRALYPLGFEIQLSL